MSISTATPTASDPIPDAPPGDVRDAICVAAAVCERLAADGCEVRFDTDPLTGRLLIVLRELSGRPIARLSAGDVIELAAGGSLL